VSCTLELLQLRYCYTRSYIVVIVQNLTSDCKKEMWSTRSSHKNVYEKKSNILQLQSSFNETINWLHVRCTQELFWFCYGSVMVSWLVCSPPDRVVRDQAPAGDIVLCFWARHFTLTVSLSTQAYKWVPANLILGVALQCLASHPSKSLKKYS